MSLKERALKIKVFLMDVDGVLTDGRLRYTEEGETIKSFHVHDGLGIKMLQRAGIITGVISGRKSPALETRLKELGVEEIFMGRHKKERILEEIIDRHKVSEDEVCFIGDDLIDIDVLSRVGFPVAVKNAPDYIKDHALYVTLREGGDGAVREVVDLILKLRGEFPVM